MKFKRIPEDFRVEELTDIAPADGPYALYRLEKRWIGTPEAVEAILQCWRIDRQRVSWGGLKDFHAVTQQYLTIQRGPRRDLQQERFDLCYLGQVPQPFQAADVAGNRFEIVLRDLDGATADGVSGQFIAEAWCRGDHQRALWLAVAEANEHDTPARNDEKSFLRDHWGDWSACLSQLEHTDAGRVLDFLAQRPTDFRSAMARLPIDLRSLYVAAFQSHLWNRLLDRYLRSVFPSDQLGELPLRLGPVAFPRRVDAEQAVALGACQLPLPSARLKPDPGPIRDLLDQTLDEAGIELRQIRIKYPRDTFFSKGYRAATFVPRELTHRLESDELYSGRLKLSLSFRLGRGCYATLLVKRLEGR